MKFKLLFSYRFLLFILSVIGRLSATDQALVALDDALLHHFVQHVSYVLYGRHGLAHASGSINPDPRLPSHKGGCHHVHYDHLCHLPFYASSHRDT